jgi:hypothetical protein
MICTPELGQVSYGTKMYLVAGTGNLSSVPFTVPTTDENNHRVL